MKILLGLAVSLFVAAPALAQGYGMAGCGLGSIVAKELSWENDGVQVFAATTNGTAYSQSFAITFGTSNCGAPAISGSRGAVEGHRAERKVYLQYNMAQIKADAARGEGEYIAGLAGLFGCRNQWTGSYDRFAKLSNTHHGEIFNSDDADQVLSNYERTMNAVEVSCAHS